MTSWECNLWRHHDTSDARWLQGRLNGWVGKVEDVGVAASNPGVGASASAVVACRRTDRKWRHGVRQRAAVQHGSSHFRRCLRGSPGDPLGASSQRQPRGCNGCRRPVWLVVQTLVVGNKVWEQLCSVGELAILTSYEKGLTRSIGKVDLYTKEL